MIWRPKVILNLPHPRGRCTICLQSRHSFLIHISQINPVFPQDLFTFTAMDTRSHIGRRLQGAGPKTGLRISSSSFPRWNFRPPRRTLIPTLHLAKEPVVSIPTFQSPFYVHEHTRTQRHLNCHSTLSCSSTSSKVPLWIVHPLRLHPLHLAPTRRPLLTVAITHTLQCSRNRMKPSSLLPMPQCTDGRMRAQTA
jgi:hypothetical protein